MLVIRLDVFQKCLQRERLFADWDDDKISVLKREVYCGAFMELSFVCKRLGNTEREAVAPFLNSSDHVYTMYLHGVRVKEKEGITRR
jgi:hypothetical protein